MFYCKEDDRAWTLEQEVLAEEALANKVRAEKVPDDDYMGPEPYVYMEHLPEDLPKSKEPSPLMMSTPGVNRIIGIWQEITAKVSDVHNLKVMTCLTF
jgi:hypothetical protein